MAERVNRRSGLSRIIADYLPLFSINLCGLIAIRIWIQCNLYDRYITTDSGVITIVSNLVRVLLIVVLLALVIRRGFSEVAQKRLGYVSIIAMTVASILFLVNEGSANQVLLLIACICAGCGIVWGGGMWITLYVRLHPGEALLYAFLSLGVSSALGFFLGLLPENITYLIAMIMPTLSMIMYQRAQRIVDERESTPVPLDAPLRSGILDAGKDCVYDAEPKSTFTRLILGMIFFNLALGIARGYPSGDSIALPLAFQALHQFSILVLSLGLLWWALGKRRGVRFSTLWNISVALIILGVLFLAFHEAAFMPVGAMLISVSNTFAVGLLWFSCYDVARHSSIPSYVILGVGWGAHILSREIGRAAIWIIEPHTIEATILIAFMVFLLALAMGFLLSDSIPVTRQLFAELRKNKEKDFIRDKIIGRFQEQDSAALSVDPGSSAATSEVAVLEGNPLESKLVLLGKHYHLTEREMEVIELLAQGRSRVSIGEKLYITENTVRTYTKNIYAKLDIHSKQELLDRLEEQGSVS